MREFRYRFPHKEIKPQEEYPFELNIGTQNLPSGNYTLKLDLLKEGAFWFEDKGVAPLVIEVKIGLDDTSSQIKICSEVLEVILPERIYQDTIIIAPIRIKNTGNIKWFSQEYANDIQVGCRIFKEQYKRGDIAIKELRAYPTTIICPGEILETGITLDFRDIPKGRYTLLFDMVNEKRYWFSEVGAKPLEAKVNLL